MANWNKESNQKLVEIIGDAIKAKRLQRNISQEELSALSGISVPSIIRLETGKGNISLKNLLSIMKALEMANELKAVFSSSQKSPLLLAKATSKKTQERVRRSHNQDNIERENWIWGEDEK